MKHAFPNLLLAVVLGAAACGGGDAAGAPGPSISAALATSARLPIARPSVRFDGRAVQLCTQAAGSAVPLCAPARQPRALGRIVSATAAHMDALDHLGANEVVALNVDSHGQAWLCKYSSGSTTCLPVQAPVPQNVDIRFWTLPDGYHVISYAHRRNTPIVYDPDARVTIAFQAALQATAAALSSGHLTAGAAFRHADDTDDAPDCGMNTDPESCGKDKDNDPPPAPDTPPAPSTGDGSARGGGGGGWGDYGWDEMGVPFAGLPSLGDDVTSYAATACSGSAIPGFIVICIDGNRPPPMADTMPLPTGPAPWFPQSWCDFASILCTNGQEPHAGGLDGSNGKSPDSGKTLPQLLEQCGREYGVRLDICQVDFVRRQDNDRFLECTKNARTNYTTCTDAARGLTGNGTHPAP